MLENLKIAENLQKSVEIELSSFADKIETMQLKASYEYLIQNGGKRFRPLLTMLSCGILNNKPEVSVKQAAAIELLHNFTLVHDDIMDSSPLRRGSDTIHSKWDNATAILLGDIILALSFDLLKNKLDDKRYLKLQNVFQTALTEVCFGQAYDLEYSTKKDISLAEYEKMIEKKTSSLIKASLLIGGICGGASDEELEKLNILGTKLGVAFQLQDDLLDISGDQKDFGKNIGQDIVEGKKTYLIIRTMEKAKQNNNTKLMTRFYEEDGLPPEEVANVKKLMEELGVIEESKQDIENKFNEIFNLLNEFPDNEYRDELINLLKKYKSRNI